MCDGVGCFIMITAELVDAASVVANYFGMAGCGLRGKILLTGANGQRLLVAPTTSTESSMNLTTTKLDAANF